MNDSSTAPRPVKPRLRLVGTDGNVFAVIGRVKRCLVEAGRPDTAKEFVDRAFRSHNYDDVLRMVFEYVEPY